MPQDLDSLLAHFLPTSAAAGVFIAANRRVNSSVHPELRAHTARIIRFLETNQSQIPGAIGEYHLMDLDGRRLLLVSSALNGNQAVSLLFPTETSFEEILTTFSKLANMLNAPDLTDLTSLKPRKNGSLNAQNWQDALFAPLPESEETNGIHSVPPRLPDEALDADGWMQIF